MSLIFDELGLEYNSVNNLFWLCIRRVRLVFFIKDNLYVFCYFNFYDFLYKFV